ncbi:MAG: ATP-binding protein [Flavobacteriaceae bacterium]|jgi:predicted AAA+ superfamily ATPase|nr:ATP-binding protein [Flavobacteriaceae bacterium]
MIERFIEKQIQELLPTGKAIVLIGARQTGKTTVLKKLFPNAVWLNGDDADTRQKLTDSNADKLKSILGNNSTLIIDEAQRIENIGLTAKIIIDQLENIQLILSGSFSFELANKINEPLTGRKWELQLFPLSYSEMCRHSGDFTENRLLETRLLYGYYPEVVKNEGNQTAILKELSSSYLYKDILTWENIQKPDKLERLVQAIALKIGNLVSYNELAQMSGLNVATVERYINLLEKAFIVYRLGSFSRNLRNELNKSRKIYFYDTGLRNAVINQFQAIGLRNDIGGLWENFLLAERTKYLAEKKMFCNRYFWRTKDGAEIDYIEELNGEIYAYEFKWNPNAKSSFSSSFIKEYQPVSTKIIHRENYMDWLKER